MRVARSSGWPQRTKVILCCESEPKLAMDLRASRAESLLGKKPEQLAAEDFEVLENLRTLLGRAWSAQGRTQPSVRWYGVWGRLEDVRRGTGDKVNMCLSATKRGIAEAIRADKKVIIATGGRVSGPAAWEKRLLEIGQIVRGSEEKILGMYMPDEVYTGNKFTPDSLAKFARRCKARLPNVKLFANFGWAEELEGKAIPEEIDYPMIEVYPFQKGLRVGDLKALEARALKQIRALRRAAGGRPLLLFLQAIEFPKSGRGAPTAREAQRLADIISRQPDVAGVVWFKWSSQRTSTGTESLPEALSVATDFGGAILKRLDQAKKHLKAGMEAKDAGDLRRAVSELRRAEDLDRLNPEVHWQLARAHASQRRQDDAIRHFRQFVRLERAGDRTEEARAFLASPGEKMTEHAEAWGQ